MATLKLPARGYRLRCRPGHPERFRGV